MTHIAFISGTRADYGKIRPYIDFLTQEQNRKVSVFVTGMNMLKKYGSTYRYIQKDLNKTVKVVLDKSFKETSTAQEMAHIVRTFDKYLKKENIDFVFVHGDRPEVLAAASCAIFNNIPICHIEAGDISGSVDELIRHATSKLSHQFLVADETAQQTLIQLGENKKNIHIVGNSSLAYNMQTFTQKEKEFVTQFKNYAILMYHPVTTLSKEYIETEINDLMALLKQTDKEYIVIMPNNDLGSDVILNTYTKFKKDPQFHFFKSLTFEIFNYLLKNASFLIGNSSCGIKEAPFYNVPVIDIGNRQQSRCDHLTLNNFHHANTVKDAKKIISEIKPSGQNNTETYQKEFYKKLHSIFTDEFFKVPVQKTFCK